MAADHGGGEGAGTRAGAASPHAHGARQALGGSRFARALWRLTQWLTLAGGALLLGAVALTVVSVVGRYGFGAPVPGDYELVEIVCAVAVFLFFPYTHASDGNITAEFFTAGLSVRSRRVLDAMHDVVFAAIAILLAWRLGNGLVDKFKSGDMSILIHIPLWWAYSFAVLSMVLLALICVWRIVAVVEMLRR